MCLLLFPTIQLSSSDLENFSLFHLILLFTILVIFKKMVGNFLIILVILKLIPVLIKVIGFFYSLILIVFELFSFLFVIG